MQTSLLHIEKGFKSEDVVESVLSFTPFISYLKSRSEQEKTIKKRFYQYVLGKFEESGAFSDTIDPERAAEHEELLELVYACLSPGTANENDYLWAMSNPVPKHIFYYTDGFASFMEKSYSKDNPGSRRPDSDPNLYESYRLEHVYSLILEKFYHFNVGVKNEKIYAYSDPVTSLTRYFRIHADRRFIDVKLKGPLPELNLSVVEPYLHETNGLDVLKHVLPLDLFRLEGFSVMTFTDITLKYALENIRSAILNHPENHTDDLQKSVIASLKALSGTHKIEFGLLPFLKLNGKPVFESDDCSESILIQSARRSGSPGQAFNSLIDHCMSDPKPLFLGALTEEKVVQYPFLRGLINEGIASAVIIPIYYNKHLAGVMEMYSTESQLPYEQVLSGLEPAFPLIGQLLQNRTDEFNSRIESIIKRKFTSLQPAVQWKFNEAAWNYMRLRKRGEGKHEIETITFSHVYPLYGSIDIRDSTVERNRAFRDDITVLLGTLSNVLNLLKEQYRLTLIDELLFQSLKWQERLGENFTTNDEILLSQFFERDVNPFLTHFRNTYPGTATLLKEYTEAIDEEKGIAFAARRDLEDSIRLINVTINSYFEQVQQELQESYPCYFEKFRTDGVEYDIYVGQSIAPDRPFNILYLKNLRLWQLKSMAEITRLTHSLLSQTKIPLQTTQLIFVHSTPIDISFRNDERRFDVEGAYNIRYEIIKKRIDKVAIKGSSERLTQPDKIALVYFNDREIDEHVQFISYLQGQGYLEETVEYLELEELQGVSGLKAIRIGVKFN